MILFAYILHDPSWYKISCRHCFARASSKQDLKEAEIPCDPKGKNEQWGD